MKKDDIKPYIVKLKRCYEGSGVILKSTNENFYIFTAKHNFAYNDDAKKNVEKIKLENIKHDIKFNKIRIIEPYPNIKISDLIALDDIYVDFIILVIDKENSRGIEELPTKPLVIYNGDFEKSIIWGYPHVKSSIDEFKCKSKSYPTKYAREKNNDYQYVFEAKTEDNYLSVINDNISGISGGGVFLQEEDKYLVGIEIEFDPISSLICINLKTIIDEINRKLRDRFGDEIEVVKKIEPKYENSKIETKEATSKIKVNNGIGKAENSTIYQTNTTYNYLPPESSSKQEKKLSIEKILLGVVFFLFIVALGIFFFLDLDGVVNQTIIYNKEIDAEKPIIEKPKGLKGYIKNSKKGKIYYLYRKTFRDNIHTVSDKNGYFKFDNIYKGEDSKEEQILIVCCNDKDYRECRKPEECVEGKECEIP